MTGESASPLSASQARQLTLIGDGYRIHRTGDGQYRADIAQQFLRIMLDLTRGRIKLRVTQARHELRRTTIVH